MRIRFVAPAVLCAALVLSASSAVAQSRPIELGVDGGVFFGLNDPKLTVVSTPVQSLRAGFFLTDNVSIEPSLSLTSISGEGETITTYDAEVSSLWHFMGTPTTKRVYLRPLLGVSGISGFGESDSQAYLGAGFGVKIPFASRLATRLEANYIHGFADDGDTGSDQIGLKFGLSFFTR